MKILYTILILLFLSSCSDIPEGDFVLGEEHVFEYGIIYTDDSGMLSFRIDSIYDSRCPSDVVCVWQGEAQIFINTLLPDDSGIELSTYDKLRDTSSIYSFELISVAPYPISTDQIEPEEYFIELKISKL